MSEKRLRLFVRSDELTDGVLLICGGPSVDEMVDGLGYLLKASGCLKEGEQTMSLALELHALSDEEVAELPDV